MFSVKIFRHLHETDNLMKAFEHYGLTKDDCTFIREQLEGKNLSKVPVKVITFSLTII